MMLITGGATLLLAIITQILVRCRLDKVALFFTPYLLVHAIGTVCCYKEWEPESFKKFPKDVMQFQILLNFIILNAIPSVCLIQLFNL